MLFFDTRSSPKPWYLGFLLHWWLNGCSCGPSGVPWLVNINPCTNISYTLLHQHQHQLVHQIMHSLVLDILLAIDCKMTQDNSWCQSAKHKTSLLVGFHTIAIEPSSWNPFWRGSARSQKWIAMQRRSAASSLLSKLFHHEYITPALHSHWKTLTKSNIIQRRKIFTAFFLFSAAMCWLGGETILASY